ncbi:ACE1 transcription factor [Mycena belliarum]|uniref:ACE1 transcription factor n=1 Tax=Mycena belliarum TaxID=1033014 RepID=A0AAD6TPY4_9AGAR|nr:ACE1 transcription factor [Mycena belliae]
MAMITIQLYLSKKSNSRPHSASGRWRMVFVNDRKFSCEQCISGHRSTTCSHTYRPLFEVAKKGRPRSQCSTCRELRMTKRHHLKCMCPQNRVERGVLLPSSSSTTRRYRAFRPALPNGLIDATLSYIHAQDARQQVRSLRNEVVSTPKSLSPRGVLAPMLTLSSPVHASSTAPTFSAFNNTPLPPMRIIASLAGSGCTCGVECLCPGCVEHRGPVGAASGRRSCTDGCGTCTDAASDLILTRRHISSIERFFACAAALPAPPTSRKEMVKLPKLHCCGQRCACPEGACGCDKSCDGCCSESQNQRRPQEARTAPVSAMYTSPFPPRKSACCGG